MKRIGVAAVAFTAFGGVALAQTATQPPQTPPATPGSPQTIPEKTQPGPASTTNGGSLSEKLDKSEGVIKPPADVDPAMTKTAPATPGTMPVIKPPEEKGGPIAK